MRCCGDKSDKFRKAAYKRNYELLTLTVRKGSHGVDGKCVQREVHLDNDSIGVPQGVVLPNLIPMAPCD